MPPSLQGACGSGVTAFGVLEARGSAPGHKEVPLGGALGSSCSPGCLPWAAPFPASPLTHAACPQPRKLLRSFVVHKAFYFPNEVSRLLELFTMSLLR